MKLSWKLGLELSPLHLAWCRGQLPANAAFRSPKLSDAAQAFADLPSKLGLNPTAFWECVFASTPDCPNNHELAERVLRRLHGPELSATQVSSFTSVLSSLETQYSAAYPELEKELNLRMQPLLQLWEAYGPGLLRQISQLTTPDLLVESAEVHLVQPALGGFGFAHLSTNRIHFEAVLTNSLPNLPESLRLAWLLAQLDLERPTYSELINRHRLRRIAGLALIPAALFAGSELGVSSFGESEIALAIQSWQPETLAAEQHQNAASIRAARLAPVVMTWWETWRAQPENWNIALTGLDRMVEQFENV